MWWGNVLNKPLKNRHVLALHSEPILSARHKKYNRSVASQSQNCSSFNIYIHLESVNYEYINDIFGQKRNV